jgi:hypothetical protein
MGPPLLISEVIQSSQWQTLSEVNISCVSSYVWDIKMKIFPGRFSNFLLLNARITKNAILDIWKLLMSSKGHEYYTKNGMKMHSNLFLIRAQISQVDLSRVQFASCLTSPKSTPTLVPSNWLSPPNGLTSPPRQNPRFPSHPLAEHTYTALYADLDSKDVSTFCLSSSRLVVPANFCWFFFSNSLKYVPFGRYEN